MAAHSAVQLEIFVRYEQRKNIFIINNKLAKWCHRFQCCNCASFKQPLGITRRQYWINEIGWNLKWAYLMSGQWLLKNCAPMMSRFRRTHWRRWWLPKRNQCRLSVCHHTWIHVLREATHSQVVSRKHHRTIRLAALRLEFTTNNEAVFYYLTFS